MAETYDLVIAGAGPAGLLAAAAAGRAGYRVALLERKADAGRLERMCGQTLVSMNDYYFDELIRYNPDARCFAFLKSGFTLAYPGPAKHLFAWHIYSPNGTRLPFGLPEQTRQQGDAGAVGIAYDKQVLLRSLLDEAAAAGVDVLSGIDVTGVHMDESCVRFSGSGRSFEGRIGIAADGTNSRIARLTGFNRDRTLYCYLLSRGWYMTGLDLPEPDILISGICFEGPAPGYMFIFPRPYDDQATVVFLTLDPRVDLDGVADYFMNRSSFFSGWFRNARRLEQLASAQYVFSPVQSPLKGRLLLAGDTGACQELENSGAMLSGWKAGCAAAAALKEERSAVAPRALDDYARWWRTVYVEGCRHEDYIMNFALPYVLDSADDFDFFCSLVRDPLPPCWNPYAAVAHMGGLAQKLAPELQKHRPDVLEKLAGMARPMSEILKSTTAACGPRDEFV